MFSLGIEVTPGLLVRQVAWFAPEHQPFLVSKNSADRIGAESLSGGLPAELRDTFEIYNVPDELVCVLLSEEEFNGLGRTVRSDLIRSQISFGRELTPTVRSSPAGVRERVASQSDGHRFVWWPSLLKGHEEPVLDAYLRYGRRPSRHSEVPERLWEAAHGTLPGAKALAGTLPHASGPNCFG
ncbi:MAG: hypothetical protein M3536_06435, partial [Actinomycetota bacterium]|nr:hypothetical protein [Actinomycetota bacterium]